MTTVTAMDTLPVYTPYQLAPLVTMVFLRIIQRHAHPPWPSHSLEDHIERQ